MAKELRMVMDIEADGLLDDITKIHCLSLCEITENLTTPAQIEQGVSSYVNKHDIISALDKVDTLIGHNIVAYDLPALEKVLGYKFEGNVIDTLAMSWYLQPNLPQHGLEYFGEQLGVPKPEISDWSNLSIQDYINRCTKDVVINTLLWQEQSGYLNEIAGTTNVYDNQAVLDHLHFKMVCLRDQEAQGIHFDRGYCVASLTKAEGEYNQRVAELQRVMPASLGVIKHSRPKVMYKKDGNLSSHGEKWFARLEETDLPFDATEIRELPNPGSVSQVKQWLYSLGWEPSTFKLNDKEEKVPQISLPFGQGICSSVKDLYEVEPGVEQLEGLYMIKHRIGLFKSFLKSEVDGKLRASAHGFTNTLRLAHSKPIANIPGVGSPWGKELRGCLVSPEGYNFIGCDISGLESATRDHYLYYFDPEYVKKMRQPGYDPHSDLAMMANLMTQEQFELYKESGDKAIGKIRRTAKVANFALTYGAQPAKIAETAKISLMEAKVLFNAYWDLNWSMEQVVNNLQTKKVRGQQWIYNPVAKFWYFLKKKKDRFSTLNQGTGAFVFDRFLYYVKQEVETVTGTRVSLQIHDEFGMISPGSLTPEVKEAVARAMKLANEELKLNVTIEYDLQFGKSYGDVH